MTAPAVQNITGKEPLIGFIASTTIANAMRQEETETQTADVEEVEQEDGAVAAVVTSNLGVEVSANGTALSGYTAPEIGAALEVGDVAGYCINSSVSRTSTLARFSVTTKKEDSITAVS
jgi:hypothetical protein